MVLSCFGKLCAKEASKQPKKRYNEYVPAVFPNEAPDWTSPIGASTTRNISTVQDYVGENIQRAPKVSRRLWRRIVADHSKNAALGQVKVGVHCYIGLLSSMNAADTSLLAEEIIRKEDSVVPLLLSAAGDSKEDQARCILGLELLVHFIRAQSSSDVSALLADHTKQACAMLQQGGSAERDSAALRVLREYVSYTRKLTVPCEHLPAIQSAAHDWLLRDSKEAGIRALDPGFMQAQQVDDLYTTTKTSRVAQALLQELSLLCQDTTVGAQVVASGLQSISSRRAWDGGSRQQVTLQELRAGQQASGTQLLLLSGLLDELRSPSLPEGCEPAVLHAAAQEASSVPGSLAPSALAKILTATAPLLPLKDSAATDEEVQMTGMVGQCVRGLAQDCREPSVLLEAVASTLRSADPGDPQAAILSVKAANIVIGCLEPDVQAPTALYTELCRLATMPQNAAGDAPVALQASASRAAANALQLSGAELKPAAVQALLLNVDHQLGPTARHTPAQLAAAAALHNAVVARAPAAAPVQSAQAAVPRMGGAAAAPRRAADAVELICTNQNCLNAAFQRMQPPQVAPALLPPRSCTSLQVDPSSGQLVATGAAQGEAAAQASLQAMHEAGQAEKFCAAVERVLAQQPPAASTTAPIAGAAWAPDAEALAGIAAAEDGEGYVLESADTLTGSGMEGMRRVEHMVASSSTCSGAYTLPGCSQAASTGERCSVFTSASQHVQDCPHMPGGAVGGLLWGPGVHIASSYRNGATCVTTPGATTATPSGTNDELDAYFMMPPSPDADAPLPFSPTPRMQDTKPAAAATGQATPAATTGAALPTGDAPAPAPLAPLLGQAAHPSGATPAPSPQPNAPTQPMPSPQAAQPPPPHAAPAPRHLPPAATASQPGDPLGSSPAAPSAFSSASGAPSASLNGMLAIPPVAGVESGEAPTGGDGSPAGNSALGNSATKLAGRNVFAPPAAPPAAAGAAAGGVQQLGDMHAGTPEATAMPRPAAGTNVPQLGGGVSQMSAISVDTEVPKNGTHNEMHDESLSLPLGPGMGAVRSNKPLHVLPPASPPNRPPRAPSGVLDGVRDSSAWSPPPAIATRSLHALPGGPDSHRGITPCSSVGDVSSWSHAGAGRSIHAVSRDLNERSQTEQLTPGRSSGAPHSPSGMSAASFTSSARYRRGRPSLHVLPGRSSTGTYPGMDQSALLDSTTAPV